MTLKHFGRIASLALWWFVAYWFATVPVMVYGGLPVLTRLGYNTFPSFLQVFATISLFAFIQLVAGALIILFHQQVAENKLRFEALLSLSLLPLGAVWLTSTAFIIFQWNEAMLPIVAGGLSAAITIGTSWLFDPRGEWVAATHR